jgi:hypothetical protein
LGEVAEVSAPRYIPTKADQQRKAALSVARQIVTKVEAARHHQCNTDTALVEIGSLAKDIIIAMQEMPHQEVEP